MPDTIIVQQVADALTVTATTTAVQVAQAGTAGAPGVSGATFSQTGAIAVTVGQSRYYMAQGGTLTGVIISAGTAPTSTGLTVDVLKNGASVFTNPPTLAVGAHKTQVTADVVSFSAGDYYTVDVTVADGANLVVQLLYV